MAEEKKLKSEKPTATVIDLHQMAGILTRSRSRICLDRKRSGVARFDALPQSLSEKRRRILLEEDCSIKACNELSRFSIKDLRTRRVFSNGFGLATPKQTVDESEKGIGRIESGFLTDSCLKPKKSEKDIDVSNGSGGLVEECVQSTPPGIDLLGDAKVLVEQNGNPNVEFVREKQSNEMNPNNSMKRSFLRPCSRVKLFKAPGSFSYRRLLPYLMDISEENSYGQKMDFEETSNNQEILADKSTKEFGSTKSLNLDSGNLPKSTSIKYVKEPPMVDEWSKPIVSGGIEKSNFKDNSVLVSYGDSKLMNTGETENSDVGIPKIVNNFSSSDSLVQEKNNSGKDNENCQCFEATKPSGIEGLYKTYLEGSTEVLMSDGERHENLNYPEHKNDDNDKVLDHIDNSNKENAPRMQPEDDFIGKPEVVANGGNGSKCMHKVPEKPLVGNRYEDNNSINDKRKCSSPSEKLVMNRRSRLKLFRTPGSMSYRRMLPFLMNIEEENYCASGDGHVLKHEKKLVANTNSCVISDFQEIPLGNAIVNDCHAHRGSGHNNALQISATTASSNYPQTSSKLFIQFNGSPNPLSKQQELDVHFEKDILDKGRKLESGPEIMGTQLCAHSSSGSFSGKEDEQASPPASSASPEEDCNNPVEVNNANSVDADSLNHESSLQATSFCLNIPAPAFNKGILKRTPRGCRGSCTCLNCSSFHLHAEKAFEFSRNQMQDAEELASHLIMELSCIRTMLENSTFSADGHALVDASQVKEACRRASEAEEVAQNRLSEMNFDLNIHCRLACTQRPRVRFANCVEEKAITELDLPTKCFLN